MSVGTRSDESSYRVHAAGITDVLNRLIFDQT